MQNTPSAVELKKKENKERGGKKGEIFCDAFSNNFISIAVGANVCLVSMKMRNVNSIAMTCQMELPNGALFWLTFSIVSRGRLMSHHFDYYVRRSRVLAKSRFRNEVKYRWRLSSHPQGYICCHLYATSGSIASTGFQITVTHLHFVPPSKFRIVRDW